MEQTGKPGFTLILRDWHRRVPCSREKHIRKEYFMQTCKVENKCIIQMNMCTYWMTLCLTRFLFCSSCKRFVRDKENPRSKKQHVSLPKLFYSANNFSNFHFLFDIYSHYPDTVGPILTKFLDFRLLLLQHIY